MKVQAGLGVFTAFLESLFFLGVMFGFLSVHYVLEKERYFENLCNNQLEATCDLQKTVNTSITDKQNI